MKFRNLSYIVIIIFFISINSYCQVDDSRRTYSTVICEYNLPLSRNGLSVSAFNVTPRIKIERFEKSAQIILDIEKTQGAATNPNPSFEHSYNYNGKQYGEQYVGYEPFKNIAAVRTSIMFEVLVTYGSQSWGWKRVDGMTNQFGPIDKDAKASEVMVNVRIVGIGSFNNTSEIENKIRELSKPQTTNSNPITGNVTNTSNSNTNSNTNKQQTNSTSKKTNSQSGNSSTESAKSNSTTNSNNQSSDITNMSNAVGLTNKESIQVFQQNGNYYIKKQDGSTTVTTKQYYDEVQTISASNAQILENNKAVLNDPLANYNNPQPTNSNSNIEAVGQFVDAVSPMLEQWADNLQKKRDAEEKRAQEEKERKKGNSEHAFRSLLNKYLISANNGNEEARLILIYDYLQRASWGNNFESLLPDRASWINEAIKNKNFNAMNYMGAFIYNRPVDIIDPNYGITTKHEVLKTLEDAANIGSLDAMMILGNYYNLIKRYFGAYGNNDYRQGGADEQKALYWYSKAADSGSPIANYNMGMILRYKSINETYGYKCIKYKIKPNDTLAFNYFLKSVSNPDYKVSEYQKIWGDGSFFTQAAYQELSLMYEKGIGCTEDKEIAKKLRGDYKK